MRSLEGEEATHKSELTVNRSRKNLSETFHPFPASLSHAPGNLPGDSVQLSISSWAKHLTYYELSEHAWPMLNHRAMSHISKFTVSLCHLRLLIKLAAVKQDSSPSHLLHGHFDNPQTKQNNNNAAFTAAAKYLPVCSSFPKVSASIRHFY
ncbi:hypothetical protein OUZ56_009080 [Daphnia magna]|uniref:Uncharacterized protein n=1 Tax=Daphnia magna TaxID=35525 RepID=A0ABR0AEZ8_9CRUS|nr:hypothetical protein OUZ56_009080 [Daphnia magna]